MHIFIELNTIILMSLIDILTLAYFLRMIRVQYS